MLRLRKTKEQLFIYLKQIEQTTIIDLESSTLEPKYDQSLNDHSILVVEDEDPVRLFTVLALKNAGYNVESAKNANDALAVVKQQKNHYDIVLTDISLGDMDGAELAESIKSYLPDIKLIFTSGYDKETLSSSGIDMPTNSAIFLSKPYNINELIETTSEVLKK